MISTRLVSVISGMMVVTLSSSVAVASADGPGTPGWSQRMRNMKASLEKVVGGLIGYQGAAAEDASRAKERALEQQIALESAKLSRSAHGMAGQQNLDPALKVLAQNLERDLEHGATMWKQGHRAYARNVLLQSTALCMACHTRHAGPSAPASLEPVKNADPLVKATYFAAVRDFDQALDAVRKGISDPALRLSRSTEWERFVRQGLQISVRYKQSPEEGIKLLDQVLAIQDLPVLFKEDVESWKRQLKKWEQEAPRVARTEQGQWAEALRLSDELEKARKFPADRGGEIEALRLSAVLHGFLEQFPGSSHLADALYFQGVAYEALRPAALWNVSESFWSACIRQAPHSAIARRCYRSLEDSVLLGWTGTGGLLLPDAVRARLKDYSELAAPVKVQGGAAPPATP